LNRIDRLHAILTHLQSKKKLTAKEIAARFNLSLRTVYRDVKALEESGVPIIGEAGIGYSVMEGYRLPPVMFTQEEASALLLSSKLAERLTDASIKKNLNAALFKIKAVLRGQDKDYIEQLNESVAVSFGTDTSTDASHLIQLQKALIEKKVVRFSYASPYKETVRRDIEPIGLYYYSTGWHLIAWCLLRNNYRDFRLSRIRDLQVTDECYTGKKHLSLQEYIDSFQPREFIKAVVLFDKKVARYIVDQKYLRGFISEEEAGDQIRMTFLTPCVDYLARWLLMFTDAVIIQSPESLMEKMQQLVLEAEAHYSEQVS
jgi:predicted DNA-binding transcriptional regulator YafY